MPSYTDVGPLFVDRSLRWYPEGDSKSKRFIIRRLYSETCMSAKGRRGGAMSSVVFLFLILPAQISLWRRIVIRKWEVFWTAVWQNCCGIFKSSVVRKNLKKETEKMFPSGPHARPVKANCVLWFRSRVHKHVLGVHAVFRCLCLT